MRLRYVQQRRCLNLCPAVHDGTEFFGEAMFEFLIDAHGRRICAGLTARGPDHFGLVADERAGLSENGRIPVPVYRWSVTPRIQA